MLTDEQISHIFSEILSQNGVNASQEEISALVARYVSISRCAGQRESDNYFTLALPSMIAMAIQEHENRKSIHAIEKIRSEISNDVTQIQQTRKDISEDIQHTRKVLEEDNKRRSEMLVARVRQEGDAVKQSFVNAKYNGEEALKSYLATYDVEARKLVDQQDQRRIDKLTDKMLELSSEMSVTEKWKSRLLWAAGIAAGFILLAGIYGEALYRKGLDAGDQVGFARARNEEIILKKRDAFWDSELGKRAFALHEEGKLKAYLDFAESKTADIVRAYPEEVVDRILLCKQDEWKVRFQKGTEKPICFPQGTGFIMPPEIGPERNIFDKMKGN